MFIVVIAVSYLSTTSHQSFGSSGHCLLFIAIIIMVIAPPLCAPHLALPALSSSVFLVNGALRLSSFFLSTFLCNVLYSRCALPIHMSGRLPQRSVVGSLSRRRLSAARNSFLVCSKLCLLTSAILVILRLSRRCCAISLGWSVLVCE